MKKVKLSQRILHANLTAFKSLMAGIFVFIGLIFTGNTFGQITQVGTAQTAAGGNTVTINKPAGVQVNDILIATIAYNENSGNIDINVAPTGPSGWILIQDVILDNGDGDNEWMGAVFYKIAVASDVSAVNYSFTLDTDVDGSVGGIIAFRNVSPLTPFDVAPGTINVTNSATITANSITTVNPNSAILMLAMVSDNNLITDNSWTTTSPGALTELFDAGTGIGGDNQVGAAWAIQATAGATGDGTATIGSVDENGGILLALRSCTPPTVAPVGGGASSVCVGAATPAFTDATNGGVWSIINGTGSATIAGTGIATGVSAGSVTVVYTVTESSGCTSTATAALTVNAVPSQPSAISGPVLICPSSTGNAYSVTNVSGVTYTWSIPGAGWSITSGQGTNSITLTAGASGTFPQTLTVVPSNGCGNGTSQNLVINQVTPGTIVKGSNPGPACGSLDPGTISSSPDGTGTSFRWEQSLDNTNWSNATGTITNNTYNPPNLNSTTYYRRIRISGSCELASNVLQYIVNPFPTVLPIGGGAVSVCVGSDTPPFTDGTPGGIWSSSNTGIATILATGVAHGVVAGNANIIYTVTDVNGCSTSVSTALNVVSGNPTQPSAITGSTLICPSSTGNAYSVTNVIGITYAWTFNPGGAGWSITSGQGTNSVTLSSGTIFPQTLTVTPTNACGNTGTPRTLVINQVTPGVVSKGASNPGPACASLNPGATVNTDGGTGTSYLWQQSTDNTNWSTATGTSTGSTYDPPNLTTTTYYRRLRITGTCQIASNVLQYVVNPNPVVPAIGGGATGVCVGSDTPAFTNSAAGGVWSTSNGSIATINAGGIAHGVAVGNVNIIYTITDVNGCSGSSTKAMVVQSAVPAQPSTITGGPTVCDNDISGAFSVTNVAGVTYTWSITGAGWSIASGQGTNSVTLNTGATFPQTLTVTPSNGCGSGTPRTLSITNSESPVFCTDCNTCTESSGPNPDLVGTCPHLKVALVIDESGSVSGSQQDVEDGVMAFVGALSCVGVELSVIEFSGYARYVLDGYQVINDGVTTAMQNYFDNVNNALLVNNADYNPNGATNYQAALLAVDALPVTPDLILFFTDGIPTSGYIDVVPNFSVEGNTCGSGSTTQAAELGNAMKVSNKLKCEGTHIFVYGVGGAQGEIPTISSISGPDAYVNGSNTISTADYATGSFTGLEEGLASFVEQLCPFSTVINTQNVCPNGSNGSISLSVPSQLFPFNYEYFNDVTDQSLGSGTNINTSPLVISNLAVGSYRLEVEVTIPGSGCTRTETFFFDIFAGAVAVTASITDIVQPNCADLNGGSATLTITAGQAPYTIILKKGGITETGYPVSQNGLTYPATGLDFGSYTFELVDANLCNTDIDTFILNEPVNCCAATCPADIIIECSSSTDPSVTGSPTNTGGCGTITYMDDTSPGSCPVSEIITRTWSGSISGIICIQIITVEDHTGPIVSGSINPSTIEGCIATDAPGAATTLAALEALAGNLLITDACAPDSSLSLSSTQTVAGTCPIVVTRTYYVTDACNNTSVAIIQTINVNDTSPPIISSCPMTFNLEGCSLGAISGPVYSPTTAVSSEAEFENGTNMGAVSDACGITSVTYIDVSSGTCPVVVTRNWTISDGCGNSATCNQAINVNDSSAPVITVCAVTLDIEGCNTGVITDPPFSSILTSSSETVFEDLTNQGNVSDACGITSVTYTDVSSGTCPIIVTRRWTISDACGNSSTCNQSIHVNDTSAPVISACAVTRNFEGCNTEVITDPPFSSISASSNEGVFENLTNQGSTSDACGIASVTYIDITTGSCPMVVIRKWTISDACGNSATCNQTINVNDSFTPVISTCAIARNIEGCNTGDITDPPFSSTLSSSSEGVFEDATNQGITSDACGITSVTYVDVATGTCPTVVTREWTVSDACGHSATCIQTINVNDTTTPTINACAATLNVEGCNTGAITDPPFSATTAASSEGVFEDATNLGNISDACTVTSVTYVDVSSGTCPIVVTRKWTVVDACGHTATCNQTINVNDTTSPTISSCAVTRNIVGCNTGVITNPPFSTITAASSELEFESAPNLGNISDACGITSVTYIDMTSGTCPTIVIRKWTVSDACGHSSTCNQTINVNDSTSPIIISCAVTRNIEGCNTGAITSPPFSSTTTASSELVFESLPNNGNTSDACGITSVTYIDVAVGSCPIIVTRKWTVSDECGHSSTCNQTINVDDNTPPILTCPNVTSPISCPAVPIFGAATATDACDASVGITFSTVNIAGPCPGTFSRIRTWTATDDCGNTSTCSRTIVVQDITPPVITCPNVTSPINCPATPAFGTATATDACDASVAVTFSDATTPGACSQAYSVTRTWIATDDCGNSSSCSRTIVVQDITPPVLTCPNVTSPINCPANPVFGAATATDACDASVDITFSTVTIPGSCPQTFTRIRTWTATDDCGNTSTCSRSIVVQDITPPAITCPANITIVYPASTLPVNTGTATSSDICDTSPTLSYTDTSPSDICASEHRINRTWVASDACGNSSTCLQTILVEVRGSICGSVYDDFNQPLSGVEIRLIADVNGNEIYDGGDTLVAILYSDVGTGNYCFQQLRPCHYIVVEIQPVTYGSLSDYDSTPDPDGDDSGDGPDNQIPVTLSPSEADADNNFVDIICPTILPVIPPDTICANGNVVFQINDLNLGALTYSWNFGSGSSPLTGLGLGPISVNYVTTTNNQVNGAVVSMTISKTGCTDLTGEVSHVEINPYPNAAINGSTANLCFYANRTFQPVAPPLPGATYQWTFGSGAVPLSASGYGPHTVYYTTTGLKTVKLVIHPNEPGAQCPDSSSISFTVTTCFASIFGSVKTVTGVGIGSVQLFLYADNNVDGIPDNATIVGSGNTVLSGNYSITSVIPGNYVLIEMQPSGWLTYNDRDITEDGDLFPNIDTLDNLIPVTLGPSESDGGNNFKESPAPGSITGYVFNDINADTLPDIVEGLLGVTLSIFHDDDKNGHADSPVPITTQITDATGFYAFTNVPVGNYVIAETQPIQYVSIKDYDFIVDLDTVPNTDVHNDTIPFSILNGELDDGNYFVEAEPSLEIFCPPDITINCQASIDPINTGFATATDNCNGVIITHSETSTQNPDENLCSHYTYVITRTWEATDACGDYDSCIQIIQVQDVTAPIFTFCPSNSTIDCPQTTGFGIPIVSDSCDPNPDVMVVSTIAFPGGVCPQEYSLQRTWIVTDACGNTSTCDQVITVQDITSPLITCPADVTRSCQDDLSPTGTGSATATDNCDSGPAIISTDVSTQNSDPEVCGHYSYTITRTWKATDACGNTSTCNQVITVQDVTSPLITCPSNVTRSCQDDLSPTGTGSATVTDNCDSGPALTSTDVSSQDSDPGVCGHYNYTITRTWKATDACGNTSTCDQVITVQDATSPLITCPPDVVKNCQDDLNPSGTGLATATDNCDSSPAIISTDVRTQNSDPEVCGHYSYTITRTWKATDVCGNMSTCDQIITVQDNTSPLITCPADVIRNCQDDLSPSGTGSATTTDNCDSSPTITSTDVSTQDSDIDLCGHYSYTITRTWRATDACGNTSTCDQVITVQDVTSPLITCPPDVVKNCQDDLNQSGTALATATDNCDSNPAITSTDVRTQNSDPEVCGHYSYTITRTWKATDACGNTSTCNQVITVQDVTSPLITCPSNVTKNCQDDLNPSGTGLATATDNCDSSPAITSTNVSTQNSDPEECGHYSYTITRTWKATDACGNTSTCIQVITVQDITSPLITCPADVIRNCQDDLSPSGTGFATATDNCDSNPTITSTDVTTQEMDAEECGDYSYTIIRTWKATDVCGNMSTCDQIITVQDNTSPLITCPADVTRSCQDDLSPTGTGSATATDNCDSGPAITSTDVSTQNSDPEICGHYSYTITRTWKATDACGNTSTCNQVITVQDVTSPLITCPSNVTKNCQDDLSPTGTGSATATDNCDSGPAITSSDVSTQNSDPEVCGHYSYTITRTWKATDACGNTSTCNQVITVQDVTSPLITCPSNVTRSCQDDLSPTGTGSATATDNCDSGPALTSTDVSSQDSDPGVCGHYNYTITRTWKATDACGNTSTCIQVIMVQDVTSPLITCPPDVTKNCQDDLSPLGTGIATATDNCNSSPSMTSTDVSTKNSDPEVCGHYSYTITRTWKATDVCGNMSTCDQIITVQDNTSPLITCPADVIRNCQDDLSPSGTGSATTTDNCDSSPTITSTDVSTQDSDIDLCGHYSYTFTRTWRATDACGNTSTCDQVITVQDVTSPLITCPPDVVKNCQDDLNPSGTGLATATDNCDSNPAITSTDVRTQNSDPEVCGHYSYTITRTWKATDACGNTSTCNQVITVQDVTSPLITCPSNVTKNCQDDLNPSGTGLATATDNCDSSPAITSTDVSTQNSDPEECGHYSYTITRTWKATDACGNTSTCIQVITVQDITSPLITCPADVIRNCQDDLSPSGTGFATATDNCDSNPTITSTDVTTQEMDAEECGDYSYTIIRTWKATDVCGNMSTCDQIITVQDNTSPLITCPADVIRNCQDDLSPSGTGSATATDNCSGVSISQSQTSTQNPDTENCGHYSYTITRTWKATDVCGNMSTCDQIITVQDNTSPLITCPADVIRNCQDDLSPSETGSATAADNCDSSPTMTSTDVSTQNSDPEVCGHYNYTITRTWRATDACGNTNTCDQVITIQDITSPLITCPANVTKNCLDDLDPSGTGMATATDNCDSNPTITSTDVTTQEMDAEECGDYSYTIIRTWKATDVCGNMSTCDQIISVQDNTPPLITCPADVIRNCQDDLTPSGTGSATATDNCSGVSISQSQTSTQNPDPENCGHYGYTITRTWKATDACGNTSTCIQVIMVQDVTSPLITCPPDVTKNCQDDLSPLGTGIATATDNCNSSPSMTSTDVSTKNSDPEVCGHYSYTITRTWKATDACGNTSTCIQVIIVQDVTSPLITCPPDVTKNCQDDLSPLGTGIATATDNCDSSPTMTSTDVSTKNSDPEVCGHYSYTITRTWKATDACGNTSTCDQVITVQDVTSPLISCPSNVTRNCQDDLSPLGTGIATATDNCDSNPVITSTDVSTQDFNPEVCGHYTYTITRTWKAMDVCGNTSTCDQVITVQDVNSPLISCPSNVTGNCQDDLSPLGTGIATATDNCDSNPVITSTDVSTQDFNPEVCGHYTYTITRTWKAMDACGNTSTCDQVITVQDVNSPLISCPSNVTGNCQDDLSPLGTGIATATDNCDSNPVITSTDVSTQDFDPEVCGHYTYTITRTWKATDACGNTSTCDQVITVQDVTSPLISCPSNVTRNCQDDLSPLGTGIAAATDNCDSSPAITSTDVSTQNTDPEVCGHYTYTITRTWTATDACGNTSTCDQVITVQDVNSPLISCPSNVTRNCQDDLSPAGTGIATATDNCDSSPTMTSTDVSTQDSDPDVCGHYSYTITRTWKATDACGNTSTCNQVITVQDVSSPLITCPDAVTKNCQDDLSPSGTGIAMASDNCDSGPTITSTDVNTQDSDPDVCGHYSYTITRTWKATDACGNTSTCDQVITVQDVNSPLISCPSNVTRNCQDDLSPAGTGIATATDNCDSSPTMTSTDVSTQNTDPEVCGHYTYTITRTWKATDACGNTSTCNQVITVQDVSSPLITCPAAVTKNCQDDLSPSGTGIAMASDNCDSGPTITSTDVNTQDSDPDVCGHYSYTITRTWKATDACGNTSICDQVITVQDVTSPLISCPSNVTRNCQDDLSPAGTGIATATDNCDSSPTMTSTDVSTQNTDPEVCGHYTYTITRMWKAMDACGNTSTCNQVITVQDVSSPLITCPAAVTKNCQDDLSPSGTGIAMSTDNCDSGPTITSTDVNTQDSDPDVCGHYSYTITRTWKATDACGNTSTCDQVITVQDVTSPLISCPSNETRNCQDDLSPAGTGIATATDNCDSSPTMTSTDISTQNTDPEVCGHYTYTITRTWKAMDACGNTSTCNQVITVQDVGSPLITCPAAVTKNCQDDLSPSGTGIATATDNCDSSPVINPTDVSNQNSDPEVCGHYSYTITRTWKATDACGNTSTCNQVITVQDVSVPLISCPADITINYPSSTLPANTGMATSTDNCDQTPAVSYVDALPTSACPLENRIVRTWIAVDGCGNSSTCQQSILIEDRGSICGSVHNDLGQAIAGVEIRLEADVNNNQIFDGGDTLVAIAYSAMGTGQFCFSQIRPCNYVLVEIQPPTYGDLNDYDISPDADGDDSGDGPDNQIPVTLSAIENDMDNNFVDIICPTQLPVIPFDTICANGNVVFQINDLSLGALTYTWNFGSGSSPATGLGLGPISVNYVTTTNNQANGAVVSMTISKTGCPDLSGQVSQVEINPNPNASINSSTANLCYFANRTFQPTAPVIPGATYQWNFGLNAVPATATGYGPHSVYYPTIGSKTVKLVIHPNEPGAQCPDSSSISFTVITCLTSLAGTVKTISGDGIGSVVLNLYADNDFDGIKDNNVIVASANTVASGPTAGAYSMTSLTPGNYVIIQDQPGAWLSVGDGDVSPDGDIVPNVDQLDNIIPVTLHPLISDLGNNFVERVAPGTITGSVFVDLDNDDFPDDGEGLPNVTIGIYRDSIADGHADNPVPVATQITDPTGFYSFSNIPIGNYLIAETQPVGYDSQIDIDASSDDDLIPNSDMDDDTIPVTITGGELDDQNYFIEDIHCNLLVTNTLNSGDGSLRAAIECAEDGDTIKFDVSLAGMIINITSSRIQINKEIVISSSLSPRVTIASQIPGLFEIQNDVIVEFRQLDIVSGLVIAGNMGASFENRGILKFYNIYIFRNPLLPSGEYLIRNTPNSNLVLSGSCYFEMD